METIDIHQLMRHLADVETPLAVSQLYYLSGLSGQKLAQFRETWPRVPVERRRQSLGFLIEIAESSFEVDFESVFCACLDDVDHEVRARSVEGLWESQDTSLIAPLLEMIQNDPAERVRIAAVSALGQFVLMGELNQLSSQRQADIEKALLALLRSSDESIEVRRRVVESLAYSSREEVPGIIENAYYHEERSMRVAAIFAMGRSLDRQWEPLLLKELYSHDPEFRYEATRACGELELASAVPHLFTLLTDEDREVQEVCIWALGQIGDQQARQILEAHYQVVAQDDEALREAIRDALGELALMAGTTQFPLYEYEMDAETEDQASNWTEDWIGGVINGETGPEPTR